MELSRLLTERGHEIHIVTSSSAPTLPNMTVHLVRPTAVLRPLRTVTFVRNVKAFLERHRFDLVHAVAPVPNADVYQPRGGLLAEAMERNVATRPTATRRAMKRALVRLSFKQRLMMELEQQVFREGGPAIAAVSEYVRRQCHDIYGVSAPRVRVVFNGVNPPAMSSEEQAAERQSVRGRHGIGAETLLLLFVANNFRLKGLYPLIDMISRLVVSGVEDVRLLVVGHDNPVKYQRRLDASGAGRYVIFTGPTQRVSSFYYAADVLVHPTYFDPCSRVVLEALWHGVPCITTSFNGASEVMRDGVEGFVIDAPDNVGLWVRRIEDLRSAGLRRKMSEKARSLRDKISMERHVKELDDLFAELAADKRSSRRTA